MLIAGSILTRIKGAMGVHPLKAGYIMLAKLELWMLQYWSNTVTYIGPIFTTNIGKL